MLIARVALDAPLPGLFDYLAPGLTETDVEKRASDEATRAMVDAIGPIYRGLSMVTAGAYGIYRGQIGRSASMPRVFSSMYAPVKTMTVPKNAVPAAS